MAHPEENFKKSFTHKSAWNTVEKGLSRHGESARYIEKFRRHLESLETPVLEKLRARFDALEMRKMAEGAIDGNRLRQPAPPFTLHLQNHGYFASETLRQKLGDFNEAVSDFISEHFERAIRRLELRPIEKAMEGAKAVIAMIDQELATRPDKTGQ